MAIFLKSTGNISALSSLNIQATDSAPGAGGLFFGAMTTAQADIAFTVANGTLVNGTSYYNITTNRFTFYQNGAWSSLPTNPVNGSIIVTNAPATFEANNNTIGTIYYDTTGNRLRVMVTAGWATITTTVQA